MHELQVRDSVRICKILVVEIKPTTFKMSQIVLELDEIHNSIITDKMTALDGKCAI